MDMSVLQLGFVFLIAWWIAFFMMLPIGVRGQHEDDEGVEQGTEPGAPRKPMLFKKAIFATVGGVVLTLIVDFVVSSGIINIR